MDNINTENQRFRNLINFLKISGVVANDSDFANKLGKHRNYISEIVNGKRGIGGKIITQICETFPEVNAEWLLTGEGEMLKDNSQNIINSTAGRDIIQTKQEKALDEILKEKDKQLDILHQQTETLRQQIKEKDEQIKTLLNLLQKNS